MINDSSFFDRIYVENIITAHVLVDALRTKFSQRGGGIGGGMKLEGMYIEIKRVA